LEILKILDITELFQLEQTLILIGSSIANARRDTPALYSEYARALAQLAELDLDETSARMLGFIRANIEHW